MCRSCNFYPLSPLDHYFFVSLWLYVRGLTTGVCWEGWPSCAGEGFADRSSKPVCLSAALAHNMRTPGLLMAWPVSSPSLSSGFPQGGVPETTAVSSCTFSFNLSQALKLQLPGICSLWLLQREGLFEE